MTTAQTCEMHCIPFLHSLVAVQIWANAAVDVDVPQGEPPLATVLHDVPAV